MSKDGAHIGEELPSKSQRKRDAKVLFDLARELVELPAKKLAALNLPQDLLEEVHRTRDITAHVARKRQMQFLAKQLRKRDVSDIQGGIAGQNAEALQLTARHHRAEAWRDRLLTDGDSALSELLGAHAAADAQALRQLLRNAHREASLNKPPAAARKLFRMLRELDQQLALPMTADSPQE